MQADPHAAGEFGDSYQTTSLYFDTRDFDIYHRRGSFGRGKYRVRRYGRAPEIFLERKLRNQDLVSKRRSIAGIEELKLLREEEPPPDWAGRWFHRRLLARELRPVCQISYLRTARVGEADTGPIRLTIDQDIRALPLEQSTFDYSDDGRAIAPDQYVLELKFTREMPALFKQLVARYKLKPQAMSKYRRAAEALGLAAAPVRPQVNGHGPAEVVRV